MTSLPPVRLEIRPSKLLEGEVGLFLIPAVDKDAVVIPSDAFEVTPLPWDVYDALDPKTQEKVQGFCVGNEDVFFAPRDFNRLSIVWYMNHSCDPNIGFDDDQNFVAMRPIQAGEELTWDYGFSETNPRFRMPCLCGSADCRGTITGEDWKVLIKGEHSDYLPNWLKARAKP